MKALIATARRQYLEPNLSAHEMTRRFVLLIEIITFPITH